MCVVKSWLHDECIKQQNTSTCRFGPNMCSMILFSISQFPSCPPILSASISASFVFAISLYKFIWFCKWNNIFNRHSFQDIIGKRYLENTLWRFSHLGMRVNALISLTFICVIPVSLIVSVEHVKYLNARLSPSLSNEMWVSIGSFTAAHIKSIMFRVPAIRRSWSDNLHMYLQRLPKITCNFAQSMCHIIFLVFLVVAVMETIFDFTINHIDRSFLYATKPT